MSARRKNSLVVDESEWADAIRVARILKHRTQSNEWRIRRILSMAAYLIHQEEQAEEIRTRRTKP